RRNPTDFNHTGGFDRGFDLFDDDCLWKDASCINQRARAVLERHKTGEPVFLLLHYIDPHGPYQVPARSTGRRRFARPGAGRSLHPEARSGESHLAAARLDRGEPAGVDAADIAYWIDLYDDEISYVDLRIGELVEAVERSAPAAGTIIALAADHGESFLEHGTLAHCRSLFDTEIRTPFVLLGPGIPEGGVRDTPSENLDVVPTLLDLAGVPFSADAFTGRSLVPAIEGTAQAAPRLQTSAFAGWRAACDGRFKLMVNEDEDRAFLFDLDLDPGETTDLGESDRRKVAALQRALAVERPVPTAALESARETERQLRALGYL
ncbi:MAG: sulfatase-like hydrolase/transferase, partial [Thermoanaerobaculia bacterium]